MGRDSIHILWIILTAFTFVRMPDVIAQDQQEIKRSQNGPAHQNIILLLFNFSDLSCPFCLYPLLALCDTLQAHNLDDSVWGVLTYHDGNLKNEMERETYNRILQKQLSGFVRANNINFPFILDSSHILREVTKSGSTVIVLNKSKGTVKKWQSPLRSEDIREIYHLITQD